MSRKIFRKKTSEQLADAIPSVDLLFVTPENAMQDLFPYMELSRKVGEEESASETGTVFVTDTPRGTRRISVNAN